MEDYLPVIIILFIIIILLFVLLVPCKWIIDYNYPSENIGISQDGKRSFIVPTGEEFYKKEYRYRQSDIIITRVNGTNNYKEYNLLSGKLIGEVIIKDSK